MSVTRITKELQQAIRDKDQSTALDKFRSGMCEAEIDFVARLRKEGTLRCSKYNFQSRILGVLVNEAGKMAIQPTSKEYFASVSALLAIAKDMQGLLNLLEKEVKSYELKSYLVSLDSIFWAENNAKNEEYCLIKEDLASAFSSYLYYSHRGQALKKSKLGKVNKNKISRRYYLNQLKNFSKIEFFKECEVLLDFFGYTAMQNGAEIMLKAPCEEFEKSIVLGYTGYLSQNFASTVNIFSAENENCLSIVEFAKTYYDELGDDTFKVRNIPSKRITIELPISALENILGGDRVFLEELAILRQIEKELFANLEKIREIHIYKTLSLFDIIKVQRLFAFIFCLFSEHIEKHSLSDSKLFWQSILPVFPIDKFKEILATYLGKQKATEIFDLLASDPEGMQMLDIQTHPYICIEDYVILPLGILSNSNLCRNLLQSERFRFDSESSVDPITTIVEKCFSTSASVLKSNLNYSFDGTEGEVDILTVIDDCLFIFECKNSLHPCNTFELRTTYDYIRKAATQLSNFQSLWQEESFRKYLAKKIGVQDLPLQLCSCIVLGNRMFSGWNENGHRVRPVHELSNFVSTGEIIVSSYDVCSKDKEEILSFSIRKTGKLCAKDLLSYIQEDSVHKCYFSSMKKIKKTVQFQKRSLTQESFCFDQEQFLQELGRKFQSIELI